MYLPRLTGFIFIRHSHFKFIHRVVLSCHALSHFSYGINARKFADNLKSDALTPIEKAVFWSEFAMKHHGGSYYKSTLTPTYFDWVKYYCIDFIIYCCIFSCVLVKSVVRMICFYSQSNHVKRKTE